MMMMVLVEVDENVCDDGEMIDMEWQWLVKVKGCQMKTDMSKCLQVMVGMNVFDKPGTLSSCWYFQQAKT